MRFDTSFDATPGEVVELQTGLRRITAPNPGPMTFKGTNSYLVGEDRLAVIDPGPLDEAHFAALTQAIGDATVAAILVTHSHRDHASLAVRLRQATDAAILGAGPHHFARPFATDDAPVDEAADTSYAPDRVLADGELVDIAGVRFEAIATPGHTMNHLCFALADTGILFSGDHVMGWSSSLVAPPDGAMTPYLESLERLLARADRLYLPGHGMPVTAPRAHVEALREHRLGREAAIVDLLAARPHAITELVAALYQGLDPGLRQAAGLSVLAHLERLEEMGRAMRTAQGLWQSLKV